MIGVVIVEHAYSLAEGRQCMDQDRALAPSLPNPSLQSGTDSRPRGLMSQTANSGTGSGSGVTFAGHETCFTLSGHRDMLMCGMARRIILIKRFCMFWIRTHDCDV